MIHHYFGFTDKYRWEWPENDYKLLQVIDQVLDIDFIMKFVKGTDTAIQAGGACGVWPFRLSQFFDSVYTFEPDQTNYDCLVANTEQCINVWPVNAALSDEECKGAMLLHESEHGNSGALYFSKTEQENSKVLAVRIDSLKLTACDLIQLDVEGHEAAAIRGALDTIEKYSPVIVIEEKKLPQSDGDIYEARRLLESIGYKEAGSIHRDVVFTC